MHFQIGVKITKKKNEKALKLAWLLVNGGARGPNCHGEADRFPLSSPPTSGRIQWSKPLCSSSTPQNLSLPWLNSPHHFHPKLLRQNLEVRQLQPLLLRHCLRLSRSLRSKTTLLPHQFLQCSSLAHHQRSYCC